MKCPWFRKECHCEPKAKQSLVALFVVLLLCAFSACTDYVQQMEDEHETWRAQRAEKDLEQSSFLISESALSSETRRSSSSEASVLVEESSSAESIDEVELSSSSLFVLPSVVCKEPSSTVGNVVGSQKVIRFMPPWTNTSAVMIVNGEESTMIATPDYCGWFETIIELPESGLSVYFKQTVGLNFIGLDGLTETEPTTSAEINLDSLAALSDTLWIIGQSVGMPGLYACYPEVLGECPIRILPVMMFDWLHGDGSDAENRENQAGTTSQDFGTGGCAQLTKGMVEEQLGENGVPVRAANFPSNCKYTEHLDNWFLPEVVAKDAAGKSYTNATCRNLELTLTDDGYWLGQKDVQSPEKGLFFLDDFEYLDSAKTVKNPMYDYIGVKSGIGAHNFGFTMKIQATFEYVPGQYFDFYGDDDVWVFINNVLVVDIGGQHPQMAGAVDLDTLGLTVGETYPFHIFYAERHINQSNFRMHTSIDLKSDSNSPCH